MENTSDSTHELRGNNADWFLEILGIEEAPSSPPPAAAARSETTEMSFILDDATSSVSTPTPLEAPAKAPPAEPTPDLDADDPSDLGDWRPEPLAHQVRSKRNFRWWIVVTVGIVVLIAVVAALWLPTTVEAEARDEAADYETVIDALRATLPDTQQTLAAATEPATNGIELLPLSAQLTRIDAAAAEVATRAARALPDTLPLLARGPLEDLEPTRTVMKVLSDAGMRDRQFLKHRVAAGEFTGRSDSSLEKAIDDALAKASLAIPSLHWFEVSQIAGYVEEGRSSGWHVTLKAGIRSDD